MPAQSQGPGGAAPPEPGEVALDFLAKSAPLHTPEWAAWQARMHAPRIAGKWLISATVPGHGKYIGEMTIEPGASETEFKTTATIELPEECALFSGKLPVTGIWWLEDCENTWETEKETHLIQEAMKVALTLGGMKLEKEPAFIDGSILMKINDGGPKKFSALF